MRTEKKISIVAILFFAAFAFLIFSAGVASAAVNAVPMFEKQVGAAGTDDPDRLGEWIVEEDIADYDRFFFPAAFCVDEEMGAVFVLDSAKKRVCAFSMDGKRLCEAKLAASSQPIDMAWFPKQGRLYVAFAESCELAVISVTKEKAPAMKVTGSVSLAGPKGQPVVQNVMACPGGILAAIFSSEESHAGAAFSLEGEKPSRLCDITNEAPFYSASHLKAAVCGVRVDEAAEGGVRGTAMLIVEDLLSGRVEKKELPREFVPEGSGAKCVSCRTLGVDAGGNLYVEAHFSSGEISENAWVYKFDGKHERTGKTEIFTSPSMLSNRFIALGASGAVYYMRLDIATKKIGFYRFK